MLYCHNRLAAWRIGLASMLTPEAQVAFFALEREMNCPCS